ncbi:B-like cyclin [Forsythia ovata]|uniref:B-like cyclin n=1 Tax=Forsythia ovata TaxID=205694 RepID=A0ABD1UD29_9LAMI
MESSPYVPLLLDLQTLEPIFAFDPKSIQIMELLVMATLKWRLHSVTPFDYLNYFISKLSLSESKFDPYTYILSTSSDLIVNTTRGKSLKNPLLFNKLHLWGGKGGSGGGRWILAVNECGVVWLLAVGKEGDGFDGFG